MIGCGKAVRSGREPLGARSLAGKLAGVRCGISVWGMAALAAILSLCGSLTGCGAGPGRGADARSVEAAGSVRRFGPASTVGSVTDSRVDESSGLVAAARHPGRFYTVNDGAVRRLYLLDPQKGIVMDWRLAGADYRDVEDLASYRADGMDFVVLADLGDNDARRDSITLVSYPEPRLGADDLVPGETWTLRYEDGPRDAEAAMVAPDGDWALIIEKVETGPSGVYFAELPRPSTSSTLLLRRVAEVEVGGDLLGTQMVTGADRSPDGRHIALLTYAGLTEWDQPIAKANEPAPLPWAWTRSSPREVPKAVQNQAEAVAYDLAGTALYTTSEGVPFPVQRAELVGAKLPAGATPSTSVRTR